MPYHQYDQENRVINIQMCEEILTLESLPSQLRETFEKALHETNSPIPINQLEGIRNAAQARIDLALKTEEEVVGTFLNLARDFLNIFHSFIRSKGTYAEFGACNKSLSKILEQQTPLLKFLVHEEVMSLVDELQQLCRLLIDQTKGMLLFACLVAEPRTEDRSTLISKIQEKMNGLHQFISNSKPGKPGNPSRETNEFSSTEGQPTYSENTSEEVMFQSSSAAKMTQDQSPPSGVVNQPDLFLPSFSPIDVGWLSEVCTPDSPPFTALQDQGNKKSQTLISKDFQFASDQQCPGVLENSQDSRAVQPTGNSEAPVVGSISNSEEITEEQSEIHLVYLPDTSFLHQVLLITQRDQPNESTQSKPSEESERDVATSESKKDVGREWKCDICSKSYTNKPSLMRHRKSHTGILYFCESCGKEYNRLDNLKHHETKEHGRHQRIRANEGKGGSGEPKRRKSN